MLPLYVLFSYIYTLGVCVCVRVSIPICTVSVEVQCDVCRADLPDGTSVFCVWLSAPGGQQGALMQSSLRDSTGPSLGAVGTVTYYQLHRLDHRSSLFRRLSSSLLFLRVDMS